MPLDLAAVSGVAGGAQAKPVLALSGAPTGTVAKSLGFNYLISI